jgi:cell shape-determining protein MreC
MVEKIRTLEVEKKNLLLEMEELKKQTESKSTALESEVSRLREEVESLKTLLGLEDKVTGDPRPSKPEKAEKGKLKFHIFR